LNRSFVYEVSPIRKKEKKEIDTFDITLSFKDTCGQNSFERGTEREGTREETKEREGTSEEARENTRDSERQRKRKRQDERETAREIRRTNQFLSWGGRIFDGIGEYFVENVIECFPKVR